MPTSTVITSLGPGITSNFAHWQSAYSSSGSGGTAIDSVVDLSGNSRTISATGTARPLYYPTGVNGKPSWLFDGTNDLFNIPSYTTRGGIIVVNNLRSNLYSLEGFYGSRSNTSPFAYLGSNAGDGIQEFSPSGTNTRVNNNKLLSFNTPSQATLKVISFQTTTGVTDATGYQVGCDRGAVGRFVNGYYCEVIGLSGVITQKQLDTIYAYEWNKWGITTPINFVVDGNSIGSYVNLYLRDTILKTVACRQTNMSISGQTTFQRFLLAPTTVDTLYGFPYDKNVVLLIEGTNDLINMSADSAYEHFTRYISARQAVGYKVAISTVISRDTTLNPGYEAKRIALNNMITSMTQTNNFKVVDFGVDALLSAPAAYQNTTYFSDGIHPTATGYRLMAYYVAPIIKSFTW